MHIDAVGGKQGQGVVVNHCPGGAHVGEVQIPQGEGPHLLAPPPSSRAYLHACMIVCRRECMHACVCAREAKRDELWWCVGVLPKPRGLFTKVGDGRSCPQWVLCA